MNPFAASALVFLAATILTVLGIPPWVGALFLITAISLPPLWGLAKIVADQIKKPPRPRT